MEGGGSNRATPDIGQGWDGKQEESMLNRCGWYWERRIQWLLENEEKVRRRVLIIREEGHTEGEKDWKMQIEKTQNPTTEQ